MTTITLTFNPPKPVPDAEEDVLASVLRDDGSIELWEAHFEHGTWWSSNATMITSPVVSWAHKPAGVDMRGLTVQTDRVKCDGNHGGQRCADPECWNDDAPASQERALPAISEQDATLLVQAHDMLLAHADDQRRKGNDSEASGAECSADAVLRLGAQAASHEQPSGGVPEIDYQALIHAAWGAHKYAQGTRGCIAFKHGAEWFRGLLTSIPVKGATHG